MNTSDIETIKEFVEKSVREAVAICGTQEALASRAGITQGAIGKYLRKEALPTGVTAKKLSVAVNGKLSKSAFAPHIFDDKVHDSIL
ncbi:MAG: YdaS family helix-turn-helix protein [Methylobacter sp.]